MSPLTADTRESFFFSRCPPSPPPPRPPQPPTKKKKQTKRNTQKKKKKKKKEGGGRGGKKKKKKKKINKTHFQTFIRFSGPPPPPPPTTTTTTNEQTRGCRKKHLSRCACRQSTKSTASCQLGRCCTCRRRTQTRRTSPPWRRWQGHSGPLGMRDRLRWSSTCWTGNLCTSCPMSRCSRRWQTSFRGTSCTACTPYWRCPSTRPICKSRRCTTGTRGTKPAPTPLPHTAW